MSVTVAVWLLIAVAIVAANLPWLSQRVFFLRAAGDSGKRAWLRWLEWLLLYVLVGAVALGLEQKLNGELYAQGWEFYAVTFCLFLVFSLPGFIYRFELKHLLQRR